MSCDATNLEELLGRIAEAKPEADRVSLGAMADAVGRRSFGSLLLLAGLFVLSPIVDVPGAPTLMAPFIVVISIQLLPFSGLKLAGETGVRAARTQI